jgi:phage FluMu protein Com
MRINKIFISAIPYIKECPCPKCNQNLYEVPNGFLSTSLYCPKCKNVYELKAVKVPDKKIKPEYLEQCEKEVNEQMRRLKA